MIATTGAVPRFIAVNELMFPVPDPVSPISGWLFVHEIVANVPVKLMAVDVIPLQISWLAGILAEGVGFTEIVNVKGVPVHPFAEGVTVIVANIGALVLFVAVNEGMSPDPLAARLIAVLLFVQVKVVAATGPDTPINGVVSPLQNSSFTRLLTEGAGFTVTTTCCVWGQPIARSI